MQQCSLEAKAEKCSYRGNCLKKNQTEVEKQKTVLFLKTVHGAK
jgi:hypothetical protein